ncbi:TetR/AcrR family transcriptional regulator [Massilia niabensis]|uniref:TetR/AcrR family transcriptional regulator n=1 Tax=Massilia niabensis TaxID=544910 RepID=A0ABW0L1S5_9BURK
MSRPRSEEKRLALLNAAAETVAAHGLGAPTALMAKKAEVAEGTLFRYFPTKDELLNEVYRHLNGCAYEAISKDFPAGAPLEIRVRSVWNSYIDWGLANRAANEAMTQLAASSVLTSSTRAEVEAMFAGLVPGLSEADLFKGQSPYFADAVFMALAKITMDFASCERDRVEAYKASGFAMIWRLYSKD